MKHNKSCAAVRSVKQPTDEADYLQKVQDENEHLFELITFRDYEINSLRVQLNELTTGLKKLENEINMVFNSRHWKSVSLLTVLTDFVGRRSKKKSSEQRIRKLLEQLQTCGKISQKAKAKDRPFTVKESDLKRHRRWMEQLDRNLQRLLRSGPLRAGNILARYLLLQFWGRKKALSEERIEAILLAYRNRPSAGPAEDLVKMQETIGQLEHHYQRLVNSRRWKIGAAFVSVYRFLTLKKKDCKTRQKIDEIFSACERWERS